MNYNFDVTSAQVIADDKWDGHKRPRSLISHSLTTLEYSSEEGVDFMESLRVSSFTQRPDHYVVGFGVSVEGSEISFGLLQVQIVEYERWGRAHDKSYEYQVIQVLSIP